LNIYSNKAGIYPSSAIKQPSYFCFRTITMWLFAIFNKQKQSRYFKNL